MARRSLLVHLPSGIVYCSRFRHRRTVSDDEAPIEPSGRSTPLQAIRTSRITSPHSRRAVCCAGSIDRSTRTPSCIRWSAGSSRAGWPKRIARRFCSPMSPTARAGPMTCRWRWARWQPRRRSMRSAWGGTVEEIGAKWMHAIANPIPPVRVDSPPCQDIVIEGAALTNGRGLETLPVPVSTPGYDAAPYLVATLVITRDPDTGVRNMGTYRGALKASDRLGVRMATRVGGAGGYLHWQKYQARGEPMPCAVVVGARRRRSRTAVRRSSPSARTRWPWRAGIVGRADSRRQGRDGGPRSARRCGNRHRRPRGHRAAGA